MKFQEAIKQINRNQLKPYILFHGEEEYLKQWGVQALLRSFSFTTPELNLSVFEERPDTSQVAVAMETLPFMDEHRVVLVKNTDILSSATAAAYSAPLAKINMPTSNYLVISASKKIDRRKALYKKIANEGMVVDCDTLSDAQLISFAIKQAKGAGLSLSRQNAELLTEYSGGDLQTVVNELEKLSIISDGEISHEMIDKYASQSMQYNVFRIHDLLRTNQLEEAKTAIDRMLLDDPNPIGFIGLISGNFKQMMVAKACIDAGISPSKTIVYVMDETGAQRWLAQRAIDHSKNYSLPVLRRGVYKLGRIDYMTKQGEVDLSTDLYPLLVDIYQPA